MFLQTTQKKYQNQQFVTFSLERLVNEIRGFHAIFKLERMCIRIIIDRSDFYETVYRKKYMYRKMYIEEHVLCILVKKNLP